MKSIHVNMIARRSIFASCFQTRDPFWARLIFTYAEAFKGMSIIHVHIVSFSDGSAMFGVSITFTFTEDSPAIQSFCPLQLRPAYTTSGLQPHHRPHNVAATWWLFFRGFCMPLAALDFTLLHGLHVKAMSLGAQAHPLGAVQDASQVPNADPLMLPRGEILPSHRMDSHGVSGFRRLELRNWPLPWSMQQACDGVLLWPYVEDENQVDLQKWCSCVFRHFWRSVEIGWKTSQRMGSLGSQ